MRIFHHMNFVCFDEEDLEQSIARAKQDGIDIVTEIDHESRRAVVINSPDKLKINFYVDQGPRDYLGSAASTKRWRSICSEASGAPTSMLVPGWCSSSAGSTPGRGAMPTAGSGPAFA